MNGLLGGTFNPVHLGHLSIAQDVLDELHLDSVHFLPCHTPVHRESPNIATQKRVDMLKLALQEKAQFKLNLSEVKRGGSSFMIDTLKELSSGKEAWVLILGTDAFNGIHHWKQSQFLLDYCHIVVCQRPDEICSQNAFDNYVVKNKDELYKKPNGSILFLEVSPIPCSSTFIRENSMNTQAIKQYLPQSVLEFIQLNNLYEFHKS